MKILFINPFGIGDVIFTTPLIANIKKNNPGCSISFWCNQRVKDLFKDDPRINKIFALARGDLKRIYSKSKFEGISKFLTLLYEIKREKFDLTLDFSLDHRYGLISKLLGIKRRIGFNYKNRGRFLTDRIDIDGYSDKHAIEYYLELLRFININPDIKNPEIFISNNDLIKCKNIFNHAGIKENELVVGIAVVGLSWGKNAVLRQWPAIKYAQLADKIIDNLGVKVIILGDISEKPVSEIITASMRNKAIDLTGKTSLPELIAIIKNLNLLISNDGGPVHIAVAVNTKTVSIMGPVDERVYGPYPLSDKHIVIKKDIKCRPCYQKFRIDICHNNRECIDSITTEEVYEAVRKSIKT